MTYQTDTTADKLIECIRSLNGLLEIYTSKTNTFSTKQKALQDMKTEMSRLFKVIQDSIKLNRYDLKDAFESKLIYHALSKSPQRIELSLAYLYSAFIHIQSSTQVNLLDSNHEVLAKSMLTKHRPEISEIIKSR